MCPPMPRTSTERRGTFGSLVSMGVVVNELGVGITMSWAAWHVRSSCTPFHWQNGPVWRCCRRLLFATHQQG